MAKELLRVEHVGMKFNLSKERVDDFREYLIRMLTGKKLERDEFWALKDVSFSLHEGERIGILGLNGAGKSTLLKVIAGVFKPTEGKVVRNGKIVPLLELGAGFDKNYTGRENIYLYGSVLGYSRKYMDEKYNQIVKFSGLGEFIDVPIKNYSSGMRSKLGFAIATIAEPEILILDEVLSVGDRKFRRKSERRILDMMENGTAVLFVSHSLAQVQRICNKAMILDHGQLVAFGDVDEIAELYTQMTEEPDEANSTRGGEDELAVTEKTGTKAEKTKAEKTDNVTAE
ncbi:MAG TPA: teichoic acid ABC transporter ATP-binding protein [Roseburia sp.]|nr:teichoic acid ABC transporter ATP-binding protein [Roseburia sp.]